MEYINNPIIYGVLTSLIVHTYNKKKNGDKYVHDKNNVSLKYPLILGIVVFLIFTILNKNKIIKQQDINIKLPEKLEIVPQVKTFSSIGESLQKNINISSLIKK